MANTKVSIKSQLDPFLIIENGAVNLPATFEKFEKIAVKFVSEQEANHTVIRNMITQLFDENVAAYISQKAIMGTVARMMADKIPELRNHQEYNMLTGRIKDVLDIEIEAGVYVSDKGPGRGVRRQCDRAAPEPKATKKAE